MVDAFEFTRDDLAANRAHKLTTDQQKRVAAYVKIAHTATRFAWIACIGSLVVFFGIAYYLRPADGFGQALPFLIAGAAVFMTIFIFFIVMGMIRSLHLKNQHISVIEGHAVRSFRKIKSGRWTAYYVTIAGIRFQLSSEAQFEAFRDNTNYRVFYIQYPPAHLILAVEPVQA
jgi:hypothetical protein